MSEHGDPRNGSAEEPSRQPNSGSGAGAGPGVGADDDADSLEGTISWGALADEVGERLMLGPNGVDEEFAKRTARMIVMKACGADDADEWLSRSTDLATKRGVAAIDAMTARRLNGEPLQYVLGSWGFRHLDLFVDNRVLIPRPETEIVAGVALAEANRLAPNGAPITVADLGTGSGAIGLALASEHPGAEVWMSDESTAALVVARANIAGVGRAGARVRVVEGSWFDALPDELRGRFGVIVSNPPYVAEHEELPAEVIDWEPPSALFAGPQGTEDLDHLVAGAPGWLVPDGSLVLEMAPSQTEVIAERAAVHFAEVQVELDLAGRARLVVARRPLSS